MTYHLTREEQETTINWCAADKTATIDTADPSIIRKLDALVSAYPETYICTKVDPHYLAKVYSVPMQYIRFGKPASEAKREASRQSLLEARKRSVIGQKTACAITDGQEQG